MALEVTGEVNTNTGVRFLESLLKKDIIEMQEKLDNGIKLEPRDVCRILKDDYLFVTKHKVVEAMRNIIKNKPDKIQAVSDIFNKFCYIQEVCDHGYGILFEEGYKIYYVVKPERMPLNIRRGLITMSNEIDRNKRNENKSENKRLFDGLRK